MTRRRPPSAIEPGSGDDEPAESSGADAAFDLAQDLLHSALDEVRTSGEDATPPREGTRRAGTGAVPRRRRDASGAGAVPRRRRDGSGAHDSDAAATPPTEDADDADEVPASEPRRGRRRARRQAEEFAELRSIEALETEAARGPGRMPRDAPPSLPDDDPPSFPDMDPLDEADDDLASLPDGDPTSFPDMDPLDEADDDDLASSGSERAPVLGVTAPADRRRPRAAGFMLVAALVVIVIGVAAVITRSGDSTSDEAVPRRASGTTGRATLALDPITTADGVTIERVWRVRGARFVARLVFSNPTAAPLDVVHTEVIPKSLAPSVDDITFDPQPTVVEADPVVEYSVTVPASSTVTARYEIQVPPEGRARARLESWADDARVASEQRAASTTTTAPPTTSPANPPLPAAPAPSGPATGAIAVRTVAQGAGGTFRYAGPGTSMISGNVQGSAQSATIPVAAGAHSWTQVSAPPGSTLVSVTCDDADSTAAGATATFNVQSGETVICTWTNV